MRPLWQRRQRRSLTFSPLAFMKLQYFCHAGDTEIGGFGISAKNNLLYVEDFVTVKQQTTAASVVFDDTAVADYFDQWVDAGLQPQQFARLWCHTHPGDSAMPSCTDEDTFQRVFGQNDWAVMAILSRSGQTYARLRHNAGPGGNQRLAWKVDWRGWPEEANFLGWHDLATEWQQEFQENIHPVPAVPFSYGYGPDFFHQDWGYGRYADPVDDHPLTSTANVGGHPLLIGARPPDSP